MYLPLMFGAHKKSLNNVSDLITANLGFGWPVLATKGGKSVYLRLRTDLKYGSTPYPHSMAHRALRIEQHVESRTQTKFVG